MKFLVYATEQEALDKISSIETSLGLPYQNTKTSSYANVVAHPSNGQFAVPITPAYIPTQNKTCDVENELLSAEERENMVIPSVMHANGWFSEAEE